VSIVTEHLAVGQRARSVLVEPVPDHASSLKLLGGASDDEWRFVVVIRLASSLVESMSVIANPPCRFAALRRNTNPDLGLPLIDQLIPDVAMNVACGHKGEPATE
jgi:hypothetical protein